MQMFDNNLFQHIVDQTNLHASRSPPPSTCYSWYDTTINEMKSFLGTIILMGIHRMPTVADYWSTNPGTGAPSVVRTFPLNRFMQLLRVIHFNDNATAIPCGDPGHDRAHKVRPVIQSIQENVFLYTILTENAQ